MKAILTLDCDYVLPRFAAAYLVVDGQEAAFIDNNTPHAVPTLLKSLEETGLKPENVRYVIITHVHLDHASGSAELMKACPDAKLLAHPRAAPHVIDPSKLESSARVVYGDKNFEKLYGKSLGRVAPERVQTMADDDEVKLGSRTFRFIHTRGHANHHFCIHDSGADAIFTGDSFGLCYPALQGEGLFIFPSTSPTDFDPAEALLSLDKITGSGAKSAFLTHFGEVKDLVKASRQLRAHLEFSGDLLERAVCSESSDAELDAFCLGELNAHFAGLRAFTPSERALLRMDLELNAAGIAHVARKRRARGTAG